MKFYPSNNNEETLLWKEGNGGRSVFLITPSFHVENSQGTHSLLLDVLCPDGAFSSSFVFLLSLALFSSSFWIKQKRNTSRQTSTLSSQWSCKCFILSRYCAVYRVRSVQTIKTFLKASSLHQIFDQILNPEIGTQRKTKSDFWITNPYKKKVAVKLYILEQKYYHEIPEKKAKSFNKRSGYRFYAGSLKQVSYERQKQ